MQKEKVSDFYIELENKYGAHNYHPLPVVLSKGEGVFLWDVEGMRYYDFLSSYSAVNQGHCNPAIVKVMKEQAETLCLTSRAFYNDQLGPFEKFITERLGFDKVLAMNTGAEAVETAIKIARKWGYEKKNLPNNEAKIVICENNFHGRTSTIVSFSSDENAKNHFGPYMPGFICIPYNDSQALKDILEKEPNIAAFLVEPIQGEAGVYVPNDGYLQECMQLCNEHNVLLMTDEIQTGIGRTGEFLAVEYEGVTPDVLILGKAISGGVYPVSAVLANNEVMDVIQAGQHGSTFGGNPIAAAVSIAAVNFVDEQKLAQNAKELGEYFRNKMNAYIEGSNIVKLIRGKGLLNAIVINDSPDNDTAWNICVALKNNGLLAKPTHGNIIRFAPPLVINKEQIDDCISIIINVLQDFEN